MRNVALGRDRFQPGDWVVEWNNPVHPRADVPGSAIDAHRSLNIDVDRGGKVDSLQPGRWACRHYLRAPHIIGRGLSYSKSKLDIVLPPRPRHPLMGTSDRFG